MIEINIIAALLQDVQNVHGLVCNTRAHRLTLEKVKRRASKEGLSFLTKTLPRLGKAFDKALTGSHKLSAATLGLSAMRNSVLPRLLGEYTTRVFHPDGTVLPNPCVGCIEAVRQITYLFYKYELQYTNEQEQKVLRQFEETDEEQRTWSIRLGQLAQRLDQATKDSPKRDYQVLPRLSCWPCEVPDRAIPALPSAGQAPRVLLNALDNTTSTLRVGRGQDDVASARCVYRWAFGPASTSQHGQRMGVRRSDEDERTYVRYPLPIVAEDRILILAREARLLLAELFSHFDPTEIKPRHGPGAVSTREKLWAKYSWSNINRGLTDYYPLDAYFCASPGHVCDSYKSFTDIGERVNSARVVLVPKDSRGPRLISCEPLENQWIQQGLMQSIVDLVESHPLTKGSVNFTDQGPNRIGALHGSSTGRYATLDLNEASDRVSLGLVRLLFPEWLLPFLEAARSSTTELPDGRIVHLQKFAPMGSALCFPILALTVWSILVAGAPDADTRESILVYGDDVIVPTAHAVNAIEQLESFGLKVNRDKSCTGGFFRESCGMDAFRGTDVTPVRLRTVWSSEPSPESYTSYIAFANECYDRKYFCTYDLIVGRLLSIYKSIPSKDMNLSCPSLTEVPEGFKPRTRRYNKSLQKLQYRVWDTKARTVTKDLDGWSMLLRFFAERGSLSSSFSVRPDAFGGVDYKVSPPMSVRQYTHRRVSILTRQWR